MLVYLSSYPRSGNTWVRQLIRHYFGYQSASLYPEPNGTPNLEVREDGRSELFANYEAPSAAGIIVRSMLVNDCGSLLSPELRQQLGQSQERFFLKTHDLPFREYFAGEHVIHVMREPGPLFWSYYNYLRKNEPAYAHVSLNKVIKGRVPFGSWSDHTQAWIGKRDELGERFMLYSYERLSTEEETQFCDQVARFIGVPTARTKRPLPPLEHWHQQAPTLYRKEQQAVWKPHFSPAQLHRIRSLHGKTMQQLGYDTAEYYISPFKRLYSAITISRKRS